MEKVQTYLGNNQNFYIVLIVLIVMAGLVTGHQSAAMWFGFAVAGFSAISNDSIQTLGTFLSSNRKVAWYWLWLFIGGIMVATISFSWFRYSGDISYQRLSSIPQPENLKFVQLLAPIVLIVLTRLRMPVSTTFLILATFSSDNTIQGMLEKTYLGYFLAFTVALAIWGLIGFVVHKSKRNFKREMTKRHAQRWRVLQWLSTGFLWAAWLAQDSANDAVFLPRSLEFYQFVVVIIFMIAILGFILYRRGGEIQSVITEKTDVIYVKSATLIDFVYGSILIYFKWLNDLPMSTTWVFLGMLAGREVALGFTLNKEKPFAHTLSLVMKDVAKAIIGLGISMGLVIAARSI